MKRYTVVLGTIAVLLPCCEVFATAKEPSQIKNNLVRAGLTSRMDGRLLRIASDPHDTEERGPASLFKDWLQMKRWVNGAESDDIVMKELELTGRTGTALMGHPNFKRLQEFWTKIEDKKIDMMIDDGVSTNSVWRKFKLDELSEAERGNSEKFLFYLRYATKYDDKIFWSDNAHTQPIIYYDGTKDEMFVKVGIWAAADRPNDYVKAMLLLENASDTKLLANPFYEEFLRLQLAKKWENLDR